LNPYWIVTPPPLCLEFIRALSNAWCFEGKSLVFKWASCGDSGPPQSINGSTASRLAEAKKSYVFRR
jgi:hypothetical protein